MQEHQIASTMNIGIIWGSDSGDTEDIMEYIVKKLSQYNVENINVFHINVFIICTHDLITNSYITCQNIFFGGKFHVMVWSYFQGVTIRKMKIKKVSDELNQVFDDMLSMAC